MHIRQYTPADKACILELLQMNTPQYFSPEEEEELVYYLDNFSDNYFVLLINNKVVACGGFNLAEDGITAKISWDMVHPNYQGKGVGSELTHFRIREIKKLPQIEILSVRTSQLVYPFYEKFGMILREAIKDYWAKGFDMYRLDCKIDAVKYD